MKKLIFIVSFLFIFTFFIACATTFVVFSDASFSVSSTEYYISSNEDYFWPIPNYHNISSYFGSRISPITDLPSKHSGIDIPATSRN